MCFLFKRAVVSGLKGNSKSKSLFMTADRLCLKNRKEKRVERKEKGS